MSAATLPAVSPRPRMGVLLLATVCNIAIWVLAGLFATSEFYRRTLMMGGSIEPWTEVLMFQMCSALNWALFTPLVIYIAQHLPLRDEHRLRNIVAVIVFLPYLAVFRAALGGQVGKMLAEFGNVTARVARRDSGAQQRFADGAKRLEHGGLPGARSGWHWSATPSSGPDHGSEARPWA